MARLTPKQLEDKRRFAGKAIPSMTRRRDGHDYEARRMYLITLTVEGRRPLLGQLAGDSDVPYGEVNAPHIELSPLGKAVEEEWLGISNHYPEISVIALQLMPDHLHGILFVKERLPQHLGQIIKGFKIGTNKVYRKLHLGQEEEFSVHSAAIKSQPTQLPPTGQRTARKHGLLWSIGYTDGILDHKGQLDNWLNYLRDNPRRLLIKRMHPEYFRIQHNIKLGPYEFSAMGNRYLLDYPHKIQVQCSRRLSDEEIRTKVEYFMKQAQQGAVLVSPSISPDEKAIMRAAFEAGHPLIILQENGFTDLTKPRGARFDACSKGQILILAPWAHHNQRITIHRDQCLILNSMANYICNS